MRRVVVERVVACRAEPAALWPFVTDTERLNRAIGLGRTELLPNDDDTAARYVVKTVSGGFPLEYEERPYEWQEPHRFSVRRIVRRGLAHVLENTFELRPRAEGGTEVTVRVAMEPKLGLIAAIAKLQISRFVAKIVAEIADVDRALERGDARGFELEPRGLRTAELERLGRPFIASLAGEEQQAAERLVSLLERAPDPEVDRMRPFELADSWGLGRRAALSACLRATEAGLLELTWDLVCPSCRTASERMRTLAELGAHAHCQLCDISYDLELDQAVEATFRPPPALRQVDEGPYCIGGPARTPHVLSQMVLPAEGEAALVAPEQPGRYRIFVRGGPAAILEVSAEGTASATLEAKDQTLDPARVTVAPRARVVVRQRSNRERHVKIERVEFARAAATAHDVSVMPAFRRQFAHEVLRPGLTLRIARVALLFTDLTGSTALYTRVGDAKAFGVVQDHFELLSGILAEHSGTVVKTIGDAVMAAFPGEENALRAALAMHRAFPSFRENHVDAADVRLKIGLFAGPCYVVTANGVLDYFGQSVNVAARLQGAAQAGEVVLPSTLASVARERGWLDEAIASERFEAELKGLAAPLPAERLRIDVG